MSANVEAPNLTLLADIAEATELLEAKEVPVRDRATMFQDEELKFMNRIESGVDYVEVSCGCTSKKYGDTMGKLRVYANGQFLVTCGCSPGCLKERVTPHEFAKHTREGTRKWQTHIWVLVNDKKVPLRKTVLFKYYKHAANEGNGCKKSFHRDEFICCSRCNKERRFLLRTKAQCREYHDALRKNNWECVDLPGNKISCNTKEERVSHKICRSCPRTGKCDGCPSCVCFGCLDCRFVDCNCQTCVDYITYA